MAKTTPETFVSNSKFSIVRKLVQFLRLGEEGKIEDFFTKVRRKLQREIDTIDKKMELETFTYKQAAEDLADKISDAESARDKAYLNVDPNSITTNQDAESYIAIYWSNVELAEANLKTLVEKQVSMKEAHEDSIKEHEEQITERKRRMKVLSEED